MAGDLQMCRGRCHAQINGILIDLPDFFDTVIKFPAHQCQGDIAVHVCQSPGNTAKISVRRNDPLVQKHLFPADGIDHTPGGFRSAYHVSLPRMGVGLIGHHKRSLLQIPPAFHDLCSGIFTGNHRSCIMDDRFHALSVEPVSVIEFQYCQDKPIGLQLSQQGKAAVCGAEPDQVTIPIFFFQYPERSRPVLQITLKLSDFSVPASPDVQIHTSDPMCLQMQPGHLCTVTIIHSNIVPQIFKIKQLCQARRIFVQFCSYKIKNFHF